MLIKCGQCGKVHQKRKRCRRTKTTTTQRGYGWDHQRIKKREAKLLEWQLCVHCKRNGKITPATQLDHIVRFNGVKDPKRLDPYNRQPLCDACHVAKSHAERNGTYDPTADLEERRRALDSEYEDVGGSVL